MRINIQAIKMKWVVLIFFTGFFIIGFSIVKDYGVHWDEFNSHVFGVRWYHYVSNVIINHAPLAPIKNETQQDIIHGPVVEMLIAFLSDKLLGLKSLKDVVFFRHYITWLFFFIGAVFFYFLCKSYFNSRKAALLGCLFLILHPRIFSHSFYDSVDIPLLSLYIISLFTLVRYINTKTAGAIGLHALACAILINIRSIGVVIPFLSLVVFSMDLIILRTDRIKFTRYFKNIALYFFLLSFLTILLWPYLWRNPLLCLLEVIKQTPRIHWEGTVLYLGEYISPLNLPWHYIPVWIVITTPLLYTMCFIPGFLVCLRNIILNHADDLRKRQCEFIFLSAFFLPLGLVIALNSVLYDSWRHLFFIYPAFVIISIAGVRSIFEFIQNHFQNPYRNALRAILMTVMAFSLIPTVFFMIRYHPFENVYFNYLAGRDMKEIKNNFEMDFWGLSYRKALEYIVKNDPAPVIPVYDEFFWGPVRNNLSIMPIADRERIRSAKNPAEAKYFITNYRWHKHDYPYPEEFFSIKVGNAKIICVYKLK